MPFVSFDQGSPSHQGREGVAPWTEEFHYLPPPAIGGSVQTASYREISPDQDPSPAKFQQWLASLVDSRNPIAIENHDSDELLFGIVCPALRRLGGTRVVCSYDGGHDTGWARCEALECGRSQIPFSEVSTSLFETSLRDELREYGWLTNDPGHAQPEQEMFERLLSQSLAYAWVERLLRPGFGTGELCLFGRCFVDLHERTITDDPHAPPPRS